MMMISFMSVLTMFWRRLPTLSQKNMLIKNTTIKMFNHTAGATSGHLIPNSS